MAETQQGPVFRRDMELSRPRRRYRTTTTYYQIVNGVKKFVPAGGLRYITSVNDAYSQGKSLSDAQVQAIVQRAIAGGGLGKADPNGMYFVLTSQAQHPLPPYVPPPKNAFNPGIGLPAWQGRPQQHVLCADQPGAAPAAALFPHKSLYPGIEFLAWQCGPHRHVLGADGSGRAPAAATGYWVL